jgi:hypothetical protein
MRTSRIAALTSLAVLATGCMASRGIRTEPPETPPEEFAGGSARTTIRLLSATAVSGLPSALVSTGDEVWVSIVQDPGVQALDARNGQRRGEINTPVRAGTWPSVSTTPGILWILVRRDAGGSRLTHLLVHPVAGQPPVPSARLVYASRALPGDSFVFPRMTRLVGATSSALWLLSRAATGYTLWRRDLRAGTIQRSSLPSFGSPGVATSADRVYVLLQTRSPRRVVLQTRDTAGVVVRISPPIRTQGTFEPSPLVACDGQIFGWTRSARGAALFDLMASGSVPRYSGRLPPHSRPSKLTAIALDRDCQNVWVSTVSHASAVISRIRSATLAVSGQIDTSYIRALLWTRGTLWASDLAHQAVLRFR